MRKALLISALVAATALAACGGGGGESGTKSGKTLAPAATQNAKGNVTFCVAKDTTGSITTSINKFNATHPGIKVKILELPESQDETRAQLIQRLRAKSPECDVMAMDPTMIAEFAAQGWLKDLTPVVNRLKSQFIPSTVESAHYQGKYWGLPYVTDTGFLYYRTDKVSKPPATWEQAYADAKANGGLVYQGSKYEGLTADFIELLFSAGGQVLSPDGKKVVIDSAPTRQVLNLMVSGIKDGAVPKAVTTYLEEESRRAFESGRAALMRNWPYAYALGQDSKIKGKFAVIPVPGFSGHTGASVLGGYDLGISAYSRNPGAALAFAQFLGGPEAQRIAGERSFPPTRADTYNDPSVREALPVVDTLRKAIAQAKPRPVTPVYPQISEAIQNHVYAALQGKQTPDQAAQGMQADIQAALKTF
jgi:multiple sugar transport system substrate-binding protein